MAGCCGSQRLHQLLVLSSAALLLCQAVQQGCRCRQFQSALTKKSGEFKSPRHPEPYPLELPCLLYVFVADVGEIVQLTFEEFSLKPERPGDSRCEDFVRLFLDSPRAELSPTDRPNYELCGSQLPQRQFYSSTRILMLELHAEPGAAHQAVPIYSGFRGTFHFRSVDLYKTDGHAVANSACDRQFWSTDQVKSGRFFSPRHPQNYPPDASCTYVFRAMSGERVRLDLQGLSLGSRPGSSNDTGGCQVAVSSSQDRVLVFDSDKDDASLLASFSTNCAPRSRQQVVSPGGLLKLRFQANSDAATGSGFAGHFAFVARHMLQPTPPMDKAAAAVALGSGSPPQKPQYAERQHQFFSSSAKEGSFTSPDFPSAYPPLARVTYRFFGEPDETVCISFSTFSLGTETGTCGLAYTGDRLLIFDGYGVDFSSRVSARCGRRTVDDFWSEGRHLTLEFRSDAVVGPGELGFAATFRFFRRSMLPIQQPEPRTSLAPPVIPVPKPQPQPQPQPSTAASSPDCPREPVVIRGSAPMSGLARTRDFPLGYQSGVCMWDLRGVKDERIVVELRHVDLEPSPSFGVPGSDACSPRSAGDRVLITKFLREPGGDREEAAPPLAFCRVSRDRPVRVMSSSLARLLVTFNATADSRTRGGLEFSYSFVRDYGVNGEFKNQNSSAGCYFEFRSWQSDRGSFTSPNYPHSYPESLACHYVFQARPGERIRIEFTNYDTESSSLCLPGDSDYVLVEECDKPNYRLQTFCGRPEPGTAFAVARRTSCLRLTFVSNNQYSAAGFHANYFFEGQTSPGVLFSGLNNGSPAASGSGLCLWLGPLPAVLVTARWRPAEFP